MSDVAACRIRRLRLWNFRNYAEQVVEFGPGINVVAGENAQGKTNLLEAVATVALTRSPRASTAADLIAWEEQECQLQSVVERPDGPAEVTLRLRRSEGGGGPASRTVTVDGKSRHARAVLGLCPVVIFWPEDLVLVKAGPEGRRRMLDMVLAQLQPRAAADLVRYRRILEQRNALLRHIRKEGASGVGAAAGPIDALAIFTAELARYGGRIRVARAGLGVALMPHATAALSELSAGSDELRFAYSADGTALDEATPEHEAIEALTHSLSTRSTEELARGVTLAGPHRDDLEILLNGRPARTSASQGQQRSIVLAAKLAEVRHIAAVAGMSPILILDDVLSELDEHRRFALLRALGPGGGVQALLSTTDAASLDGTDLGEVRPIVVRGGEIAR